MARLLLIINPVAGRGQGAKLGPILEERFSQYGHQSRVVYTTHRGHASTTMASTDTDWCDGVVSCGGDGTLGEVVNGRGDRPIPVGIIPLGTGNVLAKELGLSQSLEHALLPILRWQLRSIDVGETGSGRRFTCMVSAGIDGRIMQLLEERRRGGTMKMTDYIPLGARALRDCDYANIRVTVDGETIDERLGYACVANTHSFGGPIEMVSDAKVDDGELNVICVKGWMPVAFPALLGLALTRQTVRMPGAKFSSGSKITLSSHGRTPVPFQIDGEFAGHLPVDLRIIPGGLVVFAASQTSSRY